MVNVSPLPPPTLSQLSTMHKRLPSLALASCLLTGFAGAQEAVMTWSDGVLGSTITYDMTGPPGQITYMIPSFTAGPTPLALIDPADPRSLAVGLDKIQFAQIGFLAPTSTVTLPLPLIPVLSGLQLRAQYVTIDPAMSTPFFADKVSNVTVFVLGMSGDVVNTVGAVNTPREGHSATGLDDGTVLILGGDEDDVGGGKTTVASFEIYDPQTQSFTAAGSMTQARSTHTATKLNDGRVLIVGGYALYGPGVAAATAEIYDHVTGLSTAVAAPSMGRTLHTATLLADGRVLVIGGGAKFDLTDVFGSLSTVVKTSEIYDPVANTWSTGPNVPNPLLAHQASRLADGRVLVTSGVEVGNLFGIPVPAFTSNCMRYDPVTNTFLSTASMPVPRAYHGQITLPGGGALVVGGATGDFIALTFNTHTEAYTYNHLSNAWTAAGNLNVGRAYPNLVDTGSGITVIAGLKDVDVTTGSGTPAVEVETSSYAGITWTISGAQNLPRQTPRAVAVDGGKRILIVGTGNNGLTAVDKTAEVFIP